MSLDSETDDTTEQRRIGLKAYIAAIYGHHEILDKLLDEFDITLYSDELTGMMPIHAAAAWGNPKCLEVLIRHGCNVNQMDSMNCSPVHHAARNGHSDTVEWLIKNGANLLELNLFGQKPADLALANHFPDLADVIRREAKKQIKNLESKTLHPGDSIELA
ncbi:putative ank repeat-containing [Schistosoma mansoni]|uniref:Putative ank repeat-containing n=1 Tax=Schistosoma mansoni TaxID=6183 RepID=G4VL86_SCHMA|nr:putative ank repeat-containing [Schistosoma mansoni]|eukprot:XP_018653480.1 putative ank repeat-containing [Schistosoma mansoni]